LPSSSGQGDREDEERQAAEGRSGKVVGGHPVNYGFRMNTARDAYEVDAPKMSEICRTFRMISEEGLAITAVAKILNKEGEPEPTGGRWNTKTVRCC
jgi:hypothetical protein